MAKYRYMIQGLGYGGELVVGTASEAFVHYWKERVEDEGDGELIEALCDWNDDDDLPEDALLDPETPPSPHEDYDSGAWHDLDDLEHINSTFADSWISVYQLDDNDEEIDGTDERFDLSDCGNIYSRECYLTTDRDEEADEDPNIIPVVTVFSSEKGGFWNAVLEIDEPFDPKLLAVGNIESHLCELTEAVFYDGKQLDFEYDFADTTGKGMYAAVGWLNKTWHDPIPTGDSLEECIQYWREDYLEEEGT